MLFIEPYSVFGFSLSVQMILMPIVGGVGTLFGPVIVAIIYALLYEFVLVSYPELHLGIYGAMLVAIMILEPEGIVGLIKKLLRRAKK